MLGEDIALTLTLKLDIPLEVQQRFSIIQGLKTIVSM